MLHGASDVKALTIRGCTSVHPYALIIITDSATPPSKTLRYNTPIVKLLKRTKGIVHNNFCYCGGRILQPELWTLALKTHQMSEKQIISDSIVKRDARYLYNCVSWRTIGLPHQFAASHGSARRRETRQRRPRALANAGCVTAARSAACTLISLVLRPTAIAVDCRNIARPALDGERSV